jgi:hypothetical protein
MVKRGEIVVFCVAGDALRAVAQNVPGFEDLSGTNG